MGNLIAFLNAFLSYLLLSGMGGAVLIVFRTAICAGASQIAMMTRPVADAPEWRLLWRERAVRN